MERAPQTSTAGIDLPHDIRGLDTALGLSRASGKKALYTTILRRYVQTTGNAGREIRDALRSNDRESAVRIAHTLKGVSGTVGATLIHDRAACVEDALRLGEPMDEVRLRLVELEVPLGTLVHELREQLCSPALS